MKRGSQVWWLYHSVDFASLVVMMMSAMGAVVVLLKNVLGLDSTSVSSWAWMTFAIMQSAARRPAKRLALAACRRAGLSQDSYTTHRLERAETGSLTAPVPPPISCTRNSPGARKARVWMSVIQLSLSVALVVMSYFQSDKLGIVVGILGVLLLPVVNLILWRQGAILEVDERGLRRKLSDSFLPWDSVGCGYIARQRDVGGALQEEWIVLQDAEENRVWTSQVKNLSPQIRADLFAWLRARTGLHAPEATRDALIEARGAVQQQVLGGDFMEKIKRGLWLNYSIQVAIVVIVFGVFVSVKLLIEKASGLDFDNGIGEVVFSIAAIFVLLITEKKAERAAKAACRLAKLPPDGRDALWDSRWLHQSASKELHVPEPPPINHPMPLTLDHKIVLWACRILGVVFAACVIWSLFDRDWKSFSWCIVGTLLFLGGAALLSREVDVLQVDETGLRYGTTGRLVPWKSVERGWTSVYRGFSGKGTDKWLCLQNTYGGKIFAAPIHRLPPQVRADLFAWIQARTGLREPNLHEEMYAWLESISGAFAHR